jgi:hypothetical protein
MASSIRLGGDDEVMSKRLMIGPFAPLRHPGELSRSAGLKSL